MHTLPLAVALDRQTLMILALSIMAGAGAIVGIGGWILARRIRRSPLPAAVGATPIADSPAPAHASENGAERALGELDTYDALDALEERAARQPPP